MSDLPPHIAEFLDAHVESVEQIEILLLLKNEPQRLWTVQDVTRVLSTNPASIAARLMDFASKGIVSASGDREDRYRYDPATAQMKSTINDLCEVYSKYRVRVISRIYSKPLNRIRTLADAFKIRKKDE